MWRPSRLTTASKLRRGNRASLLNYLFPPAVRARYHKRLLDFRFDTLPSYRHRIQSRIYRFVLDRQRRWTERARFIHRVARHGRRVLLGPPHTPIRPPLPFNRPSSYPRPRPHRLDTQSHAWGAALPAENDENTGVGRTPSAPHAKQKMPPQQPGGYGAMFGGYGGDGSGNVGTLPHERGSRRRKLAAMAGSVYRAGVAAASELKQQYDNSKTRGTDDDQLLASIPGSFPHVPIVTTHDDEQMVLFPSYAKMHVRQAGQRHDAPAPYADQPANEEYWRHEWASSEDKKALVDVDVRGWVYAPTKLPLTRRNRILLGLARRLSGVPAPTYGTQQGEQLGGDGPQVPSSHEERERMREEQKIAREAREIERKGRSEEEVAIQGKYSEPPRGSSNGDHSGDKTKADDSDKPRPGGNHTTSSMPSSPTLSATKSHTPQQATLNEMTEAELTAANANLLARIGPFMTTPSVELPVTIFFYNDTASQSRTVTTNESGHFSVRAVLDFIPTHVRVLADEWKLSATEPVRLIEPTGVSVISDIDDTIKRSNIPLGAREIFRNTFIRDLADLSIEGVHEWYGSLHRMGVQFHYCSNSPWQLYPVLATFFITAGLPQGSLHLKQYSGMLQGIFEPVAERKKSTLDKILRDFPERSFLLVGDSGEADLEVYTDLALANPGRILAIFIRDVTTPKQLEYFDPAYPQAIRSLRNSTLAGSNTPGDEDTPPALPPRKPSDGPIMGTLIDLTGEPEQLSRTSSADAPALAKSREAEDAVKPVGQNGKGWAPSPARPAKPLALRSAPSEPVPRKPLPTSAMANGGGPAAPHPLAQMQNSSDQQSLPRLKEGPAAHRPQQNALPLPSKSLVSSKTIVPQPPPPPPPPRRRGTHSSLRRLSPRLVPQQQQQQQSQPEQRQPTPSRRQQASFDSNSDVVPLDEALPGSAYPSYQAFPSKNNTSTPPPPPPPPLPSHTKPPANPPGYNRTSTPPLNNYPPAPSTTIGSGTTTPGLAVNKKAEMWQRRVARAHELLDQQGVALYTWRRGEEVIAEAEGIVREAMGRIEGGGGKANG